MPVLQVHVDPAVLRELRYLVRLHKRYGAPFAFDSLEPLIAHVLAAIAEGSRRPGAWERSILESLGLVANCDEHECYRTHYGPPTRADDAGR